MEGRQCVTEGERDRKREDEQMEIVGKRTMG